MEGTKLLEKYKKELSITEAQREAGKKLGQNTNKLKNRAKDYRRMIKNLEKNVDAINKLKTNTYYSVNIACNGSCTHSVIMYVRHSICDVVIFNATYEDTSRECWITEFNYIEILRELTEMK